MSFDLLPPTVLIEIFHQLPFKDRVRMAGVNRSFRDASEESINRMKSLDVTDFVATYSLIHQSFSSILESSSSTLQSIDATNPSYNKVMLRMMADFMYPKLERLEITVIDDTQTTKLIGRCPNVRSIVLCMSAELEWPENIVFEKLEKLEIRSSDDHIGFIDLSQMVRPLVGKAPNLKKLTIESGAKCRFMVGIPTINQLLAAIPSMQELKMLGDKHASDTYSGPFIDLCRFNGDKEEHPVLTISALAFGDQGEPWSTILPQFAALFPGLRLRELHLRMGMSMDEFVDVITNIPSIAILRISSITDAMFIGAFMIDFLTSTAAIVGRDLEIRMDKMVIHGFVWDLDQMVSDLEEMEKNGGPAVEMKRDEDGIKIESIRYMTLDG